MSSIIGHVLIGRISSRRRRRIMRGGERGRVREREREQKKKNHERRGDREGEREREKESPDGCSSMETRWSWVQSLHSTMASSEIEIYI